MACSDLCKHGGLFVFISFIINFLGSGAGIASLVMYYYTYSPVAAYAAVDFAALQYASYAVIGVGLIIGCLGLVASLIRHHTLILVEGILSIVYTVIIIGGGVMVIYIYPSFLSTVAGLDGTPAGVNVLLFCASTVNVVTAEQSLLCVTCWVLLGGILFMFLGQLLMAIASFLRRSHLKRLNDVVHYSDEYLS